MCGISGLIFFGKGNVDSYKLFKMTKALSHRGPDHQNIWLSKNKKIGFGHARLAILDPSSKANQPMMSSSKRYVITFNGEIYNFLKIKKKLNLNIKYKTSSDTEIILYALDNWGVEKTIKELNGMFSIAIWDNDNNSIYLARDRIGIKPLYYKFDNDILIFSSELKPVVLANNSFPAICSKGFSDYIRFGYIPGPSTIFEKIYKVNPSTILKITKNNLRELKYWDLNEVIENCKKHPYKDIEESVFSLKSNLNTTIKNHMISDRSIGALLSGGVDSSTIVSLMQKNSASKIKTFSIGFNNESFNEAKYAKVISDHLNTDHCELYISDKDAFKVIDQLPNIYDEPFSDTSQIPTSILSELTRKNVVVALSGDGGDELFAGYNRYIFTQNFYKKIKYLPVNIRILISSFLLKVPSSQWDLVYNKLIRLFPKKFQFAMFGQKVHKFASIISSNDLNDLYYKINCQWTIPEQVINKSYFCDVEKNKNLNTEILNLTEQQMVLDTQHYLVDDILTKVDRASMHYGLELRVPFLDHKIIETAWRIPFNFKMRNGHSKWILKKILYDYVPKKFLDRPKMGFEVPIDNWLRMGLKNWADYYLSKENISKNNYLNHSYVNEMWKSHLERKYNFGNKLWNLLMFETWLEKAKKWI